MDISSNVLQVLKALRQATEGVVRTEIPQQADPQQSLRLTLQGLAGDSTNQIRLMQILARGHAFQIYDGSHFQTAVLTTYTGREEPHPLYLEAIRL